MIFTWIFEVPKGSLASEHFRDVILHTTIVSPKIRLGAAYLRYTLPNVFIENAVMTKRLNDRAVFCILSVLL